MSRLHPAKLGVNESEPESSRSISDLSREGVATAVIGALADQNILTVGDLDKVNLDKLKDKIQHMNVMRDQSLLETSFSVLEDEVNHWRKCQ